jgi:hypothetical protein
VNAGVDFRHAPVHAVVLGDPRTNDAYPMRTKLDKWEAHFYSSLANCVLQMLLAAEALGLSSMYISDVASPYFSVMLKSLLGIRAVADLPSASHWVCEATRRNSSL